MCSCQAFPTFLAQQFRPLQHINTNPTFLSAQLPHAISSCIYFLLCIKWSLVILRRNMIYYSRYIDSQSSVGEKC